MNRICLVLLLSALATHGAFAQASSATPAAPKPATQRPPPPPPLTKDQVAELSKAYGDAIKSDPDLVTQQQALRDKQKALADEQKAYQEKLNKALVAADPSLADLISTHPNLHPAASKPPATPKPAAKPKAAAAPKSSSSASTNGAPANPTPPKSGD